MGKSRKIKNIRFLSIFSEIRSLANLIMLSGGVAEEASQAGSAPCHRWGWSLSWFLCPHLGNTATFLT